jgi:DNA repair exonuclease SbcCD nuclease subunit
MLITADVHLHTFKAFADKKSEMNSRLKNTLSVLDQMLNYTIKHNDKQIIFVGDTFETKNVVEAITNNNLADWLNKCHEAEVEVILLVGNHDISSLGDESITLLHPLNYFPNVKVINQATMIPFEYGTLSFVPFRRSQETCRAMINEMVAKVSEHNKGSVDEQINFLFYHGAVVGAKISNREFLDAKAALSIADLHPNFFTQVFLGHFHQHQKLMDNVRYVSAPLHHDANDSGDTRGFYHYDLKENKLKFVKTKYPSFIKLDVNEESDWGQEIDDYNYYIITVAESLRVPPQLYSMPNVKILKQNKRTKIQRLEIEYKASEKINIPQTIETYVGHINKAGLDQRKLIEMGISFASAN